MEYRKDKLKYYTQVKKMIELDKELDNIIVELEDKAVDQIINNKRGK